MRKGKDVAVKFLDFYIVHQNLPDKRTKSHFFPEHILFIPLSGEVRLGMDEYSFSIGPGFMGYVPPNRVHEFSSSDQAGERIIVMFKTSKHALQSEPKKLPLSQLLKEIIFYLLTHPKAKSESILRDVFIQTLSEIMEANKNIETPEHIIGKIKDLRLKKAMAVFEERFAENLKVGDIAKASGLSARNFTRLLGQETGLSPKQLIVSLRIEEAKRLLLEGATVLEASQSVGYDSLSQFIAAFRSRTGQLPSKFAQNG
ncbi:MAG: helix-turn-helix domain-containing protein [Bdellovibrionaceae bacterium]|nr:helix-turn-helix domain-containing protein [Pseudobdellovibrionaceae bacterium]